MLKGSKKDVLIRWIAYKWFSPWLRLSRRLAANDANIADSVEKQNSVDRADSLKLRGCSQCERLSPGVLSRVIASNWFSPAKQNESS